jgi:peptide/nickel transport system substrate-binding protein
MPATDVATAESAGLTVSDTPGEMQFLLLENRGSGPLANQKVRQALARAVDRKSILSAIFAGIGTSYSTVAAPGFAGFDKANAEPYPFDAEAAKQELTEAGYPNGFSLNVLDTGTLDPSSVLGQAVVSNLAEIGVTANLEEVNGGITGFIKSALSKQYDALVFPLKTADIYTTISQQLNVAIPSISNAWALTEPALTTQLAKAAQAATPEEEEAGMQQATRMMDTLAWAVPIVVSPYAQFLDTKVQNVPASVKTADLDPFSPVTDENWYSTES